MVKVVVGACSGGVGACSGVCSRGVVEEVTWDCRQNHHWAAVLYDKKVTRRLTLNVLRKRGWEVHRPCLASASKNAQLA